MEFAEAAFDDRSDDTGLADLTIAMGDLAEALYRAALAAEDARSGEAGDLTRLKDVTCDLLHVMARALRAVWAVEGD